MYIKQVTLKTGYTQKIEIGICASLNAEVSRQVAGKNS